MFFHRGERLISALAAAARSARVAWPSVGRLLHEAEAHGSWEGAAENFTAWMRDVAAPACGLKETSVWRYLRAFRIYERLRTDFAGRGDELPPPEQLQAEIGPESLELLDKLTRVAPRDVTDSVMRRLLAGDVEREEIRTLWKDYRPALLGRTAQGRGVHAPKVDTRLPLAEASLSKARVLSLLRQGDTTWAGAPGADRRVVFADVQLPAVATACGQRCPTVDAVVLLRAQPQSRPAVHGVFVCTDATPEPDPDLLDALAPYFNQIWVLGAPREAQLFAPAPKHRHGVLRVHGARLVVEVTPQPSDQAGVKTGELAIDLLMQTAFRKA